MASRRGGVVVPISTEFNNKGLEQAQRQLNGFGKSIKKSFVGIGATLGGAFALGAITDQVGQMVSAASDLAESQSKVKVVFGQSAKQINDWASTSATSLLMTKQAALEAAGTYGNLFQAFGIGRVQATEMSTTLVQLAADLASFNNTSVDDAIQALRSGLSGETEPLKRFGVALTDARLRQEALNMGIYDGRGILNAAQKAQASYALILKDTALAQGDVERTADGYANTVRAVTAAVGNAQAIIGGELVDSVQDVSKALGGPEGAVSLIEGFATGLANVIDLSNDAAGPLTELAVKLDNLAPDWLGNVSDFNLTKALGPIGPLVENLLLINEVTGSIDDAERAMTEMTQQYVRMAPPIDDVAQAEDSAAAAAKRLTTAAEDNTVAMTRRQRAAENLKKALDKLNDKRSIMEQRFDLRQTIAGGASKSGERTVVGADGRERVVRFSTQADRKEQAFTIADQAASLAGDLGPKRAGNVLKDARQAIRDLNLPGGFEKQLLSTLRTDATRPPALRPGTPQTGQQVSMVNYNFGDIKVESGEAAKQAAKEAKRLAALSGSRYAGMAETGKGY